MASWYAIGARGRLGLGIAHENGGYYPKDMQTISLKLPDDLLEQLEQEAKARRVTKSLLVRESLEKALRAGSSPARDTSYH
jgi:Ribbon-helix-helix protein, copG family